MSIEEQIARLLTDILPGDVEVAPSGDVKLVEDGLGPDSVNLLELLVRVGKAFGITIEDEELTLSLVETIGSLADFIRRKQSAGPWPTS